MSSMPAGMPPSTQPAVSLQIACAPSEIEAFFSEVKAVIGDQSLTRLQEWQRSGRAIATFTMPEYPEIPGFVLASDAPQLHFDLEHAKSDELYRGARALRRAFDERLFYVGSVLAPDCGYRASFRLRRARRVARHLRLVGG